MNQEMNQEENRWYLLFVLLTRRDSFESAFLMLFMFMTQHQLLLNKNYALCYLSTNWMFRIFGGKDMMVPVTCVENGMDFKQNLLQSVLMHTMSTVLLTNYATTERAFSAMKLLKTRLRNKMEDDFLRDCMIIYIEREIAMKFTTDSIIDDLYAKKNRKV